MSLFRGLVIESQEMDDAIFDAFGASLIILVLAVIAVAIALRSKR